MGKGQEKSVFYDKKEDKDELRDGKENVFDKLYKGMKSKEAYMLKKKEQRSIE